MSSATTPIRAPTAASAISASTCRITRITRAFSSELDTGSHQENASNQESGAPFRFNRNGKAPAAVQAFSSRYSGWWRNRLDVAQTSLVQNVPTEISPAACLKQECRSPKQQRQSKRDSCRRDAPSVRAHLPSFCL